MNPRIEFTSFERASLLRKLSIFYFLVSILPVSVMYYLYLEVRDSGTVTLNENNFFWVMLFIMIGVAIGYFAMRSMVNRISGILKKNRMTIHHILGDSDEDSRNLANENEITILADTFNQITSHLEEKVQDLEKAKHTLHSVLSRVGDGLTSLRSINAFLDLILETITQALRSEIGVLLLVDEQDKMLTVKEVYGKPYNKNRPIKIDMNKGIFQSVAQTKAPVVIDKLPLVGLPLNFFKEPLLCAPLILHDSVQGMLVVCSKEGEKMFNEEEKNLVNNLAMQTAVAIENFKLNEDAEKAYFETITALALAVEAKDTYSRGHSERVANLVIKVAQRMSLSGDDVQTLQDAARMHDLGKIGILDKVLRKEGPLNVEEMEMMKKHSEIGEGIIKGHRSLRHISQIIRSHHEKLDGSGYPDGLKGKEITLLVRILTTADIYDALTSYRPYREPYDPQKAIDELRTLKGEVDPKVVDALAEVVMSEMEIS